MKGATAVSILGSLLIFTAIVGAIVHTWALWPQARQEWEQLLDNKPKTMLFSKQTQSKNMEKKFDVGDFVRYTAYPGAKPEFGFVKQIRLDKDGLKVSVVGVRDANRDAEWKHKKGALTPIDKLEKVD